jgi:hypothetical protein
MKIKVTITVQQANRSQTLLLGSIESTSVPDKEPRLLVIDGMFTLTSNSTLRLKGTFNSENNGLSMFGFLGDQQVFHLLSQWLNAAPYLGIHFDSVGYLEIFLEKFPNDITK